MLEAQVDCGLSILLAKTELIYLAVLTLQEFQFQVS
jgi:hypothetical protein